MNVLMLLQVLYNPCFQRYKVAYVLSATFSHRCCKYIAAYPTNYVVFFFPSNCIQILEIGQNYIFSCGLSSSSRQGSRFVTFKSGRILTKHWKGMVSVTLPSTEAILWDHVDNFCPCVSISKACHNFQMVHKTASASRERIGDTP
jgi:hypothetical protein